MVKRPQKWDKETEVLIIGTGCSGLAAAIVAHDEGAKVCVIEKSPLVGGTTSASGGALWIPCNHLMKQKGISDSREEALTYCKKITGGRVPQELIETYIDTAPEMLQYLTKNSPIEFEVATMPDYHPQFEGGHDGSHSRTLGPSTFNKNKLGDCMPKLRPNPTMGLPLTFAEMDEWDSICKPQNLDFDLIAKRMGEGLCGFGEALMAALYKGCLDRDIDPIVNTRALELITEDGKVIGITAQTEGKNIFINAKKGVILASGGFEWNEELKNAFLPGEITHPNSPPYNEGDGLKMAMSVNAKLANMTETWGWISMSIPGETVDGRPLSRGSLTERALPHVIIVNKNGKRFVNEAASYNDMFKPFWEVNENTLDYKNLPSWHIFDQQFHEKYAFLTIMPGEQMPDYIAQADSIEELASIIGVDTKGLTAEIEKFNKYVENGEDPDFHRGKDIFDHYWGDADNKPNPSLGYISKPPFYAMQNYCGTLGTKGGPRTNINAQVLHMNGEPITGLYAAGNVMASVSGPSYFGAGGTIGPGMTFGYIAAKHAAKSKENE